MTAAEYWSGRNLKISKRVNQPKKIKKMFRESYKRQKSYIDYLYNFTDLQNPPTRTELYKFAQFLKMKKAIKEECKTNLAQLDKEVYKTLKKAYIETFKNTKYLFGKQPHFTVVNKKRMESVLKTSWSGEHYSKRLWKHTEKLSNTVRECVIDSIVNGKTKQECIRSVLIRNKVAYNEAQRLIQTETAYVINKANLDTYKEEGATHVEIMAELKARTCEDCTKRNGRRIPIDEAKIGKNIPPFHPSCHCDILPVIEKGKENKNAENKHKK